jgi:hypothetical protein
MDFHNITKDVLFICLLIVLVLIIGFLIRLILTAGYNPKVDDEIERVLGRKEGDHE